MSIAEKLTAIAENEQKVFDAGKQSVYETVVFTKDLTDAKGVVDFLEQFIAPNEKIVVFTDKKWSGLPASETPNNKALWVFWMSQELRTEQVTRYATWRKPSSSEPYRDDRYS